MDTNAYLKRHGWRGDGHSLDSTDRGIRRPLLVSKKVDTLGVGLNKHAAVSDQWWMRAFDEGLKNLGSGTKSTLANVREKGVHFGGLYGRFVKGETVEGTIESEADKAKKAEEIGNAGSKRKRHSNDESQGAMSKRRAEGTDMTAGEQLTKRVDSQTKAVVREAVKRGLLAKGSKEYDKESSKKSSNVDEATCSHIFNLAGLTESAALGGKSSNATRKQAKHNREKLGRELKRVARAYFTRELSAEDRALIAQVEEAKEMQRVSKRQLKQVERYDIAARKAIAKASKSAKREKRMNDKLAGDSAISAEKAALYAERAAAKGVSVEDYICRRGEKSAAKKSQFSSSSSEAAGEFVVDLAGDPTLKTQTMLLSTPVASTSNLDVVDKEGVIRYTVMPGKPVPLDPTIWAGLDVKGLPKPVRRARKEWMAANRKARKGDVRANSP